MPNIYIVRHGNTFDAGDLILRVGGKTDLPLSKSGTAQARTLGEHFLSSGIAFDTVYCSTLQRTRETAQIILAKVTVPVELTTLPFLTEVDYGPDEGKLEDVVLARIGKEALDSWEREAIVPSGWIVDISGIVMGWEELFGRVAGARGGSNHLVVTSNGIARFITRARGFSSATQMGSLKLRTGAYAHILCETASPKLLRWNIRP